MVMVDSFIELTIAGIVMAVFCSALFGYGYLVCHFMKVRDASWAVTIVLGMALVISIGGFLNAFRIASSWSLIAVVIIGLTLSIYPYRKVRFRWPIALLGVSMTIARAILVAAVAGLFVLIATLHLVPEAFNYHDDFQKYFSHPVRMLQTGTLFGSPLNALGSQSLGGQAFLQGFIVAFFPIHYINGFDAVFAQLLCIMMIVGFAWRRPTMVPIAIFSMAAMVAINPQYVNISSLYSGSALIMATILLTVDSAEIELRNVSAGAMGLIFAALVALKPSFVLFAALHTVIFSAAISIHKLRYGLLWLAATTGWGAVFLAPWIILHGDHYLIAILDPFLSNTAVSNSGYFSYENIFSTNNLYYGSTFAHYTGLIIVSALCATVASRVLIYSGSKAMRNSAIAMIVAVAAVTLGYLVAIFIGSHLVAGPFHALRYYIPVIIPLFVAMLCVVSLHLKTYSPKHLVIYIGLPILVSFFVIGSFMENFISRFEQAVNKGSILSFSKFATSEAYLRYNQIILHGGAEEKIKLAQNSVPVGNRVISWINAPFYLDYGRNEIIDVDTAGITTRWSRRPKTRYIMLEYHGYAVESSNRYLRELHHVGLNTRLIAARFLAFKREIYNLVRRGTILYDDGNIVVARLSDLVYLDGWFSKSSMHHSRESARTDCGRFEQVCPGEKFAVP